MTINDWTDPDNTVDAFQQAFVDKTDEQLSDITEKWKGQNPGIAASIIIARRKRRHKITNIILIGIILLFFAGTIKWIIWYIAGTYGH